VSGAPDPKARSLERGERRYRRKVASPKRWQAIIDAKVGPCRVCTDPASNGSQFGKIHFHHLVSRAQGGDDVADNIVPLCPTCHDAVTRNVQSTLGVLALMLTDAEYAYIVGKLGEGGMERLFRV
jgi:5-methylcytosine-specific restriction endonuclease McrA